MDRFAFCAIWSVQFNAYLILKSQVYLFVQHHKVDSTKKKRNTNGSRFVCSFWAYILFCTRRRRRRFSFLFSISLKRLEKAQERRKLLSKWLRMGLKAFVLRILGLDQKIELRFCGLIYYFYHCHEQRGLWPSVRDFHYVLNSIMHQTEYQLNMIQTLACFFCVS